MALKGQAPAGLLHFMHETLAWRGSDERMTMYGLLAEAMLVAPSEPFGDERAELAAMLLRRLDGVMSVRASKLVLFQASRDNVPGLIKLLPDAEPPTVMAIEGQDGQVALQAPDEPGVIVGIDEDLDVLTHDV